MVLLGIFHRGLVIYSQSFQNLGSMVRYYYRLFQAHVAEFTMPISIATHRLMHQPNFFRLRASSTSAFTNPFTLDCLCFFTPLEAYWRQELSQLLAFTYLRQSSCLGSILRFQFFFNCLRAFGYSEFTFSCQISLIKLGIR